MARLIPYEYLMSDGTTQVGANPWGDDSDSSYFDHLYLYQTESSGAVRAGYSDPTADGVDWSNIVVRMSAPQSANFPIEAMYVLSLFDSVTFGSAIHAPGGVLGGVTETPQDFVFDLSVDPDYAFARANLENSLRAGTLALAVQLIASGPIIAGFPTHLLTHNAILNSFESPPPAAMGRMKVNVGTKEEKVWKYTTDQGL